MGFAEVQPAKRALSLAPVVSKELHRLARRYMRRENAGHTLQTTALVNETYVRLIDAGHVKWQNP